MTAYQVDAAAIDQLVAELDALTAYAQQLIVDVESIVKGVSDVWTGEANEAYQSAHAEWADGAATMSESLAALHARSGLAAQNYSAAVQYAAEIWGEHVDVFVVAGGASGARGRS